MGKRQKVASTMRSSSSMTSRISAMAGSTSSLQQIACGREVRVLEQRNPASIKVCTILDKPSRRKVDFKGEYVGFEIPDEFVIGYGLDYDGKYRNLKDVCVLELTED